MAEYFKNNPKIAFKLFDIACEHLSKISLSSSSSTSSSSSSTPVLFSENVVISPLSLQFLLASIYISTTYDEHSTEILKLLQLSTKTNIDDIKEIFSSISNEIKSDFFNFNLINKFYLKNDKELKVDYIENYLKTIKTDVDNINFNNLKENVNDINNECFKKTDEKICQIIDENDFKSIETTVDDTIKKQIINNINNTVLVIINGASLKALWDVSFHEMYSDNGKDDFYLKNGEKIKIDMMVNTIPFFKYGEFKDFNIKIAELRYAGYYENELSMLVLLPINENDNIDELQKNFEEIDFFDICNQMHETPMWIKFPKFKIETKLDVLKIMDKFYEANLLKKDKLNFSNIIENDPEIKINKIIHKAEIESNEIGTDERELPRHLAVCSEFPDLVHFHVNRPFIFVIKDKNVIYFIGKVMNLS